MPTTSFSPFQCSERDLFDYALLPLSIQKAVKEQTELIHCLLSRTTANIVQIGLRLQFVRDRLGRDHFQPWLRSEFQWSQSTASNYMRAARTFGGLDCLEQLLPSALFMLARKKVPSSARSEAIRLAQRGERITKGRATAIIAGHVSLPTSNHTTAERIRRPFLNALKKLSADEVESLAIEVRQLAQQLRKEG